MEGPRLSQGFFVFVSAVAPEVRGNIILGAVLQGVAHERLVPGSLCSYLPSSYHHAGTNSGMTLTQGPIDASESESETGIDPVQQDTK